MRHISDEEIEALVSAEEAQSALLEAFISLEGGGAALQKRVRTEAQGVKLSTLGAVVPSLGVVGAKVYTTIKGQFQFVILLFSTVDGRPLATFDANAITRLRTAATSVLAARRCAKPDSKTLAVFGFGVQGREHAVQLAKAFPLERVLVVDPYVTPSALLDVQIPGVSVAACSMEDALAQADIVVTASRSKTPLFPGSLLREGMFVAAIGSSLPDTRELDDLALTRASVVIVDWQQQALEESGDLLLASTECGLHSKVRDLSAVLADKGSLADEHRINIYKSVGVGLQDIAIAGMAFQKLAQSNSQQP